MPNQSLADLLKQRANESPSNSLMRRMFGQDAPEPDRSGTMFGAPTLDGLSPRQRARQAHKQRLRKWSYSHRAAMQYESTLNKLARQIGNIVEIHLADLPPDDPAIGQALLDIEQMLNQYAHIIGPWAESAAKAMLNDLTIRDRNAWLQHANEIGRNIRMEIESAPIGSVYQGAMQRQVELITSLPREAAQRVHELATGQLYSQDRGAALKDELLRTGEVTRSRAELIARTECSRAGAEFTKARAEFIGSTHYIWRSARDEAVRPRHRQLNGNVIAWTEPPIASEPGQKVMRYHAGGGPNCRCYPEPLLPD